MQPSYNNEDETPSDQRENRRRLLKSTQPWADEVFDGSLSYSPALEENADGKKNFKVGSGTEAESLDEIALYSERMRNSGAAYSQANSLRKTYNDSQPGKGDGFYKTWDALDAARTVKSAERNYKYRDNLWADEQEKLRDVLPYGSEHSSYAEKFMAEVFELQEFPEFDKYRDAIRSVVDHGSPQDALDLATRIEYEVDAPPPPPPPPGGCGRGPVGEGEPEEDEEEQEGGTDSDENDDEDEDEDDDEDDDEDKENDTKQEEKDTNPPPKGKVKTENFSEPKEIDLPDEIKEALEEAEEKKPEERGTPSKYAGKIDWASSEWSGIADGTGENMLGEKPHAYTLVQMAQTPITLEENVKLALNNFEGGFIPKLAKRGVPSARVWRLEELGDTNIFKVPPKRTGKLIVMVDMSGSMGCGCDAHNRYRPDEPLNARLAWQAAGAIAQNQKHAEFYGFISNPTTNMIVPFTPGMAPQCLDREAWIQPDGGISPLRLSAAGNPDCVALEFMAAQVESDMQNTSAVIISDGQPAGPGPENNRNVGGSHLVDHTRQLASALHKNGVRFLSVLIRTRASTIYPAEVSVKVEDLKDLRNMETAFGWLSEGN